MIDKLSHNIAVFLIDNNTNNDIEIYEYGISIILSSIISFIVVIIVGLVFESVIESIIYLFILVLLRSFTGGFHAKSYLKCHLVLYGSFLFVLFIGKIVTDFFLLFSMGVIANIIILIFSPVISKKKSYVAISVTASKIISFLLSVSFLLVFILMFNLQIKCIVIIPVTELLVAGMLIYEIILRKESRKNDEKV